MNDPKHVAPTHPPDAPTALKDVAELLQRLQELYQSLAERPDPGGETEQELLELIGQRPRRRRRVGRSVGALAGRGRGCRAGSPTQLHARGQAGRRCRPSGAPRRGRRGS